MANEELNRNQDPTNPEEHASQDEYIGAFAAINAEVQTSGQLEYKRPVNSTADEWINGVRVSYVDNQPTMDLDEVPASELLSRIPEESREKVAAIGIKPEDADRQSVFMSFAPACFERTSDGKDMFRPASALVDVTTEFPNGGYMSSTYQVEMDIRTAPAEAAGTYARTTDMGLEDVSMAEEKDTKFDPQALASLAMMDREFAPEVKENTKEAREAMNEDLTGNAEDVASRTDTARESSGHRYFLKSGEAQAIEIVARHYTPPPEES